MKRKLISLFLALVMCLTLCVPAFATLSDTSKNTNNNVFVAHIRLLNGEVLEYVLENTGHSIIATHTDGMKKSVTEITFKTGVTTVKKYENGEMVSISSSINEGVKAAYTNPKISPRLVFPHTYQNIGSVQYKTNSTGVAYNVSIQCKEYKEEYSEKYDLNHALTDGLGGLVAGIAAIFSPFGAIAGAGLIANTFVNQMIVDGIIEVGANEVVTAIFADYVEGFISSYKVKYTNQYGAGGEAEGRAVYVTTRNGRSCSDVYYEDIYPQFLGARDDNVARIIYFQFDGYAYPGVSKYTYSKTVPYWKGD